MDERSPLNEHPLTAGGAEAPGYDWGADRAIQPSAFSLQPSVFGLQPSQLAIRSLAREFADREIAPVAGRFDESGEFPIAIVQKLGALGLLGLPFPEQYGGGGADMVSYCLVLEELARVDSSVAITVEANVSLGGVPIERFGTESQRERWLRPLAQGEILGAFGLTEPGSGSDAGALTTTARRDGDRWVINGSKAFITNSGTTMTGFVTVAAVSSESPRRISTFIVPAGTPGFTVGPKYRKLGWRASDTHPLQFDDCRVPAESLLGQEGAGFRQFLATLDGGRVAVAAMGVGLIQGCLDVSLDYARSRTAFGQPIADFQAIQFKLADLATNIELGRLITHQAARLKDAGLPYGTEAAMAKLFTSESAVKAADEAIQIHGGTGYMDDSLSARFYRDAKALTIGEGTSEILRMVIGRGVVKREA